MLARPPQSRRPSRSFYRQPCGGSSVPRPTPAAQKRTPLLPFFIVVGLVAVVGGYFLVSAVRKGSEAIATQPIQVQVTPWQLARVPGIARGNADAPIPIFEF